MDSASRSLAHWRHAVVISTRQGPDYCIGMLRGHVESPIVQAGVWLRFDEGGSTVPSFNHDLFKSPLERASACISTLSE